MTEGDGRSQAPLPRRTNALTRNSRWPGWIWSVPIAAVGIVIWLLVRSFSARGVDVTVTFADAAGMRAGDTKVIFHGLEIGKVSSVALAADRRHVVAHLDLDDTVKKDLTTGTRFYLRGGEVSFSDPASLKALLAGPSILMQAGAGAPTRTFTGRLGKAPETLAVSIPVVVSFEGDVGKLQSGAPVSLRGFTVGAVDKVQLMTDAGNGRITTSVVLDLDPTRFNIGELPAQGVDWPIALRTALVNLVHHGLRATLQQSPPLIGAEQVDLVIDPAAPPVELLSAGGYPEIPAAGGGLGSLPAKLGQLPIQQIGDNLRVITEQLKKLTSSPRLQDSIVHLDRSLAELDRTLQAAGPQVAPTLASAHQTIDGLRRTADEIDATAAAARKLLGGSAASPNGNLQEAVRELTGTARAVRTLANYLDQHPEALLQGRAEEPR